jgi:hypothetical protein
MGSSAVSVLSLLVMGTSTVLADVIPISITRQVAANGSVTFVPTFVTESFSDSDTSHALGPYNVTKSGRAAHLPPPFPPDVSGSANQTSNTTSDQITIDMSTRSDINGVGTPVAPAESDASSGFSFQFTVDTLSQVHIFGAASLGLFSQLTTSANSKFAFPGFGGTQSIALMGSGVDFEPSIPALNGVFNPTCFPNPADNCQFTQDLPFDSTFTLVAGQYMLDVNTDASVIYQTQGVGSMSGSSDLSLTADFREIPEPSLGPFLLLSVAAVIWRQRTCARKPIKEFLVR